MTTPPGDGRTRLAPLLLLVLLGSLWGLGFSLAKIATRGGVPPITYSFWQSAAAAVVLSAITVLRGVRPSLSARHLRFYLVMGITGFSIPNVNIIMSVAHLPAGIAAVIVPLSPLFTCAIAWAMGFEGMSAGRAVGLALGLAGTALIALPQASLPEPEQRFWVLMATMTPLFYAIGNVVAARLRPPDMDSGALGAAVHVVNAAVLLPVVTLGGMFHSMLPPWGAPELALMGQMAIACIGTVLFLEIVRLAGPVFLSQAAYVVTVTGVLWGMALFGEQHAATVWLGMLAIFGGVLLVQRSTTGARRSRG